MLKGPIPFSNATSSNNPKELEKIRETQNSTVLEEDDSDLTDTLVTEISNSPRDKSESESAKNNKPRRKSTMLVEPDHVKKLSSSKLSK